MYPIKLAKYFLAKLPLTNTGGEKLDLSKSRHIENYSESKTNK